MINENIAKIKVVGVGGAGGNAINDMIISGITGVDFIAANTDSQDLAKSRAGTRIQLGEKLTKGLGAGANPEVGKKAVEEDKEKLAALFSDTDMLFITAGMGGGTGTGAAPEIAKIAKELGILTIAIVTKPFNFEGIKRKRNAELGLNALSGNVDALVIIPNEKLNELPEKKITLLNAFEEANNVLKIGIKGISDLITIPGFINCDFADVKTIMSGSGVAMLGFGQAEGEDRAKKAAEKALSSPLLEKPIIGARRILYNITGGKDITLQEVNEISGIINAAASGGRIAADVEAEVIFGTAFDEGIKNGIKVTIVATDFITERQPERIKTEDGEMIERTDKAMFKPKVEKDDYDVLDIPAFIRRKRT
jgi:cell division protein FtsZ